MMETLSQLFRFAGLSTNKAIRDIHEKSADWWIGVFGKFVCILAIIIGDALLRMYPFETRFLNSITLVSFAPLVVPLFALLVLGNPMRQLKFGAILAVFFHKKNTLENETAKNGLVMRAGGQLLEGVKLYWVFVGITILWATFIPLGIRLIPIQYCPTAFWIFLPTVLAHELMWWQKWHMEDEHHKDMYERRNFRYFAIKVMNLLMIACVIAPFAWQGLDYSAKLGYRIIPEPSKAEVAQRKKLWSNDNLVDALREECINKIADPLLEKGTPFTKEDLTTMEQCKETYKSPVSQKETGWLAWLGIGTGTVLGGHILWFLLFGVGTGGGLLFWLKNKDKTVAGTPSDISQSSPPATKKEEVKKAEVKKSDGTGWAVFWLLVIMGLVGWGIFSVFMAYIEDQKPKHPIPSVTYRPGISSGEAGKWVVGNYFKNLDDQLDYRTPGSAFEITPDSYITNNDVQLGIRYKGQDANMVTLIDGKCDLENFGSYRNGEPAEKQLCTGNWEGNLRQGAYAITFTKAGQLNLELYVGQARPNHQGNIHFRLDKVS